MTGLVIGDDHSVFLDAMSAVLEQRGYEVTVAGGVPDTIETVRRIQPDVCLIDRNFAGYDGITAISPMLAASSRTKVLVLSADPDTDGIRRALHAGASGYAQDQGGVRPHPGHRPGAARRGRRRCAQARRPGRRASRTRAPARCVPHRAGT